MKQLLSCLAIAGLAVLAPRPATAASLTINDALVEGSIIFTVGQFDSGVGFILDGATILAPSLGTASATVSEGTPASGPITHTFTGQFLTGGALSAPTSGTIVFVEPGGGFSDILTFSYTGGGAGAIATLTGSFVSDLDPSTLVPPPGATLITETTTPFTFNNTNITASAVSDVEAVPEPVSLLLLGTGLLGAGVRRFRPRR